MPEFPERYPKAYQAVAERDKDGRPTALDVAQELLMAESTFYKHLYDYFEHLDLQFPPKNLP